MENVIFLKRWERWVGEKMTRLMNCEEHRLDVCPVHRESTLPERGSRYDVEAMPDN